MAKKKWAELTAAQKGTIVAVAAADSALRAWAVRDLSSRTKNEVNGPKWAWALGLSTVSSVGLLPALYLWRGRKPLAA